MDTKRLVNQELARQRVRRADAEALVRKEQVRTEKTLTEAQMASGAKSSASVSETRPAPAAKKVAAKAAALVSKAAVSSGEGHKLRAHEILLSASVQNAAGLQSWGKFAGEAGLADLFEALDAQVEKVQRGDLRHVEEMLFGQAALLQTVFTNLARRAVNQESLKHFQTYLTLALKSQAQCRVTLEALAEIKNPRQATFVRGQANFASGPQQVNNQGQASASVIGEVEAAPLAASPARVENLSNPTSKLLERSDGQRLDPGTQGAASGAHQDLETVGAVDGPANR